MKTSWVKGRVKASILITHCPLRDLLMIKQPGRWSLRAAMTAVAEAGSGVVDTLVAFSALGVSTQARHFVDPRTHQGALIPFIGGLLCWLGERFGPTLPRWIALLTMSLELALGLWLWAHGDYHLAPNPGADPAWALEFKHVWIERFGISVHLALDGLSLLMILLTGLPVCKSAQIWPLA